MVSIFSDINHLNKLTLSESAATLCGYTQQELELTFAPYILRAEATEQLSHDEFLAKIKHWYNGYCFTKPQAHLPRVYNPFSILKFLYDKSFENYWFTTGTPTFVLNLLEQHTFNIPDFEHVKAVSDELENFTPTEPELTTMLYQTGYLTIQSYDAARRTYILGFPNFEVAASCSEQLLKRIVKLKGSDVRDAGLELREAFLTNRLAPIHAIFARVFAQIPYTIKPAIENDYQLIFYLILRLTGMAIRVEEPTAIGRIDAVIQTHKNIFIIEFKIRGTAQEALQQIHEMRYPEKYEPIQLPIILLGIVFDPKQCTVSEVIIENYIAP